MQQPRNMDPAFLYDLLACIMQPTDNLSRSSAEAKLFQLYESAADETLSLYLDILQHDPPQSQTQSTLYSNRINQFVALQLRLCLSTHERYPYKQLWHRLRPETQQRFKNQLFGLLLDKRKNEISNYIAEVIGNLAANLIVTDDQIWPEFKKVVTSVATTQGEFGLCCALTVLWNFYSTELRNFKEIIPQLHDLLRLGFENPELPVAYAASRCLAAYSLVMDHSQHKQYSVLVPLMIRTVQLMLQEGNNKGLLILVELMEFQPKFLKPSFDLLIEFFKRLNDGPKEESIKRTATEALVEYCSIYPTLFKKSAESVQLIVDMVIMRMLTLPTHLPPSWMVPHEGFDPHSASQPQSEIIDCNLELLNRIIKVVGVRVMLPKVKRNVDQLLSMQIWSYQYVAMMVVAQFGEYVEEVGEIRGYIDAAFGLFAADNPKLRYAAVHAIGLISDECKADIDKLYGEEFMRRLWELLARENCPRVVSHILCAFSNLVQGLSYNYIYPYVDCLMATIFDCLINGISIVKESALTTLSSLVQPSKNHIIQNLPLIFRTISQYFYNEEYLSECYNRLRGYSIECISLLAYLLNKQHFAGYLPSFVGMLAYMQKEEFSHLVPPTSFVLDCWNRLGLTFGVELQEYVDQFLPGMLSLIAKTVLKLKTHAQKQQTKEQPIARVGEPPQPDEDMSEIAAQIKQVELGIKMVGTLVDLLTSVANHYFEQIMAIYMSIVQYSQDEDLKAQVYGVLPALINGLIDEGTKRDVALQIIAELTHSLPKESEQTLLPVKLKALTRLLSLFSTKLLSAQLLQTLNNQLLTILLSADNTKAAIMRESRDYDEDEIEAAEDKMQFEEKVQQAASGVIEQILQLQGGEVAELGITLLREFLADVLVEGQRNTAVKIGLFILDDIVQYLGYAHLQGQYWFWIQQMLEHYVLARNCHVRQAAAYGLGLFAAQIPPQRRNGRDAVRWLQILVRGYQIQRAKGENKSRFGCSRENIIAAMGKIIRSHLECTWDEMGAYLEFWLAHLPLKEDREEGEIMTETVVELVGRYPSVMCDSDLGHVVQLLRVIAMTKRLEWRDKERMVELGRCIKAITGGKVFVENSAEILGVLEPELRQELYELYDMEEPRVQQS